ncbi:hypothetical protein FEE95_09090 [Maribacter algarum]|uniref:Uncharacterized protein n=1 Tax=Maribacter algarum (ex Zhang et al. 2020) TaxID=2578118 RepID=A0A5S3PPU0_9FLAO|nr:hypothetical protein [Maribacter algarum]TMM56649.1 hypothetical protein FEE95_09090 [Maribacter algarum]
MNVSETKFRLSKEKVVKIIKKNPNFYSSKSNAINTYILVSENSNLITFDSNSEKADFALCLEELKKVIIIENKELFTQKFAEVTFKIATRLKKSI